LHQCREKARGDEKNLKMFVLGAERTPPMQSLLGYHFDELKVFVKVSNEERIVLVGLPSVCNASREIVVISKIPLTISCVCCRSDILFV
jgi:hypothetical protein